jgi:hypothetical protein
MTEVAERNVDREVAPIERRVQINPPCQYS